MRLGLTVALLALALAAGSPARAKDGDLPLPRFASLAAEPVNLRVGPGTQYPIRWVYTQKGIPLEIVREHDVWRMVRDYRGEEGWIHVSRLSGRRTVLVVGKRRWLRAEPSDRAGAIAALDPKVIGRLLRCDEGWCRIEVQRLRGWLRRNEIWGVFPDEKVE